MSELGGNYGNGKRVSVIYLICSNCKRVLLSYELGTDNRRKFIGPPSIEKYKAMHSINEEREGLRCIYCNSPLSKRPKRVKVLRLKTFEERFVVIEEAKGVLRVVDLEEDTLHGFTTGLSTGVDEAGVDEEDEGLEEASGV